MLASTNRQAGGLYPCCAARRALPPLQRPWPPARRWAGAAAVDLAMDDNIITWLLISFGVFVAFVVIFLMWEVGRAAYFGMKAKWHGWSKEELHERLIARERRIWAREERSVKKDEVAARDVGRKRYGVTIATMVVALLAYQLSSSWWEAAAAAVFFYVGLTMAAGLSFRW